MGNMTTLQILQGIKTWVTTKLNLKQDVINDLANIRSGAQAGSTAIQPAELSAYFNDASYDNNAHRINFYHGQTVVAYVDASPFIVDGMVDDVRIENGYLVIDFNTASGKQDISIPLTDIFNPNNYYNKTQTDGLLAQKQDVIQDLADIRSGASAGSTAVQPSTLNNAVKNVVAESGVYDVSANNDNTKFESLSALLSSANLNTLIPTDIRKGGMSIKFVLSSDNKYVQYRLMLSTFTAAQFANAANWQGVDDEPTAESDNLVKSGGVYNNVGNLEKDVIGTITIDYTYDSTSLSGGYNTRLNRWENHLTSWGYYSKLIPVSSGKKYTITPESGKATSWAFVTAAPQNLQDLSFASGQIYHLNETEETSISTPEDAVYLVVTYNTEGRDNLKLPIITYVPKDYISLAGTTKAIDDIQGTVGNFRTQNYGSRYDNLNGALTQTSIAAFTVSNSECDSDGYISAIHITTNASGTLTFMVGLLDQRRNAVNTRTFDVTIPNAGVNNIKLDTPVYIRAGEQLFVFTNANIPTLKFKKGSNSTDADVQVMVSGGGYNGGGYNNYMTYYEQSSTGFPYGVVVDFSYTVKSLHDSLFEEKADADITKKQVESLSNAVQSAGIVYDSSGLPYRIIVVNNQLVPKSLVYKKVVALGNSLTAHEDYPSIGWTSGGDYSMASTRIEVSWTRQLQKILRTINGNSTAIVTPYSIYAWEKNPAIEPANIADSHGTYLSDVLTQDVDCVIFRAGENNASTTQTQTDYENGLTSLVNYIKQLCPTADIVITSLMWPNALKDTAFYNVANTMYLKYINSGSVGNNKEALGDYCLNVDNTTYFPIINAGVANHVNDYGFYLFANILANSFGLTPLEEVYDIEVQSNVEYYVNRTKGVYQGLITIQTFGNNQPTINVVDSNSTSISVNHFDMSGVSLPSSMANRPTWCSVFEMPNSDVTVTIGDN